MAVRFKDVDGVSTSSLFKVHPEKLVEDPGFNIRLDDDDAKERVESYKKMFLEGSRCPPLQVKLRGEELIVVDGHLRRRGALAAIAEGAMIMDVDVVEFKGNDADQVAFMLRSGQGRAWMPLELAAGYRRLKNWGWSTAQIANTVGKTSQHVLDTLDLSLTDSSIQQMVKDGEISGTLAVRVARKAGVKAAEVLADAVQKAKSEGKTRATAKDVQASHGAAPKPSSRIVQDLVGEVKRQAEAHGVSDDSLDEHVFQIEGRFLRGLLPTI